MLAQNSNVTMEELFWEGEKGVIALVKGEI